MTHRRRWVTWGDVGAEIQCALWREKLEAVHGNITAAGRAMGFSKRWAMRLTQEHGLAGYARELRIAAGLNATGRPRVGLDS